MKKEMYLVGVIFLVLIISLVIADENTQNSEEHKMNYGRCVSNLTKIKNECHRLAENNRGQCNQEIRNITQNYTENNITVNKTEIKNMKGECRRKYKNESSICMENFKMAKKLCIQYQCKRYELFLNNACQKVCDKRETIVNGTCQKTCRRNEILVNNTCEKIEK